MTYGTATRSKARLNVLRGFAGNEPKSLSYSAQPTSGAAILSGMIISLTSGKWVKGCAAGKVPYIAYHDQSDSTVESSGLLLGLSCAGDYEVQTAYFDNTATFAEGAPLLAHATSGDLVLGAAVAAPQVLANIVDVVGFTCRGGKQSVANINSGVTKTTYDNTDATTIAATTGVWVLNWFTRWTPRTLGYAAV